MYTVTRKLNFDKNIEEIKLGKEKNRCNRADKLPVLKNDVANVVFEDQK